jgi:hypothetical protein
LPESQGTVSGSIHGFPVKNLLARRSEEAQSLKKLSQENLVQLLPWGNGELENRSKAPLRAV